MSIWGDNPEWFDEWITIQAQDGRFGEEIKLEADAGDIEAYDLWDRVIDSKVKPIDGKKGFEIAREAEQDFYERFVR